MTITKKANAKINLSLDITGVLPNGYHALSTVMQSVTLHDTVTVTANSPGIVLECDAPEVPTDGRNTAYKAAQLFYDACGKTPAVRIRIQKRIPSQAGLGGGSADAAAVLKILNELHGEPLSMPELLKIGLKIGADVPFALSGGTRLCLNMGEITAELPHVDATVLIAKPAVGVDTPGAYRRYDEGAPLRRPENDALLYWLSAGEPARAMRHAANVFAELTDLPETNRTIRALLKNGAWHASLSGSGSACYGLFSDPAAARQAQKELQKELPFTALCETATAGTAPADG